MVIARGPMYGISHIRSVSVGLDSQIWYLFIYITGYLNVRKMSETIDFRTFVGPLIIDFNVASGFCDSLGQIRIFSIVKCLSEQVLFHPWLVGPSERWRNNNGEERWLGAERWPS